MLEAFERHLAEIDIAKKFEKAKTKEEKIEVCKKFLEDNDYIVHKKVAEIRSSDLSGIYQSNKGTITSVTLPDDFHIMPNVISGFNGGTLQASNSITAPTVEYITAKIAMSKHELDYFKDANQLDHFISDNLTTQITKEIRKKISVNHTNSHIKVDTDYATMTKRYGIKIGVILP